MLDLHLPLVEVEPTSDFGIKRPDEVALDVTLLRLSTRSIDLVDLPRVQVLPMMQLKSDKVQRRTYHSY